MGQPGEVENPPPENPDSAEILRLYELHAGDMTDEALFAIAYELAEKDIADEDNEQFREDPALWRAFALLELIRVLPNPRDLHMLEEANLREADSAEVSREWDKLEAIRRRSNDLTIEMALAYFQLIGDNADSARLTAALADQALEHYNYTNVAKVLRHMKELRTMDSNELQLMARILGTVI